VLVGFGKEKTEGSNQAGSEKPPESKKTDLGHAPQKKKKSMRRKRDRAFN